LSGARRRAALLITKEGDRVPDTGGPQNVMLKVSRTDAVSTGLK
jgi:hypothetical protein